MNCFNQIINILILTKLLVLSDSVQRVSSIFASDDNIQRSREERILLEKRLKEIYGLSKFYTLNINPDGANGPQKRETDKDSVYVPSCASESETFCTDVMDYPWDLIQAALNDPNGTKYKGFFEDDDDESTPLVNISQRFDNTDEESLCHSQEKIIYPKYSENKNGNWLYVVNTPKFKQAVTIEFCTDNSKCTMSDSFPNGYEARCRQRYIYRQLLAVKDGQIFKDLFKLPSCCQCLLRRTYQR